MGPFFIAVVASSHGGFRSWVLGYLLCPRFDKDSGKGCKGPGREVGW